MGRTKGTPKTGGRQVGTPNKVSGTLKEFVANLLDDNRDQIVKDIKALKPRARLAILEKMMPYVIPKQQSVEANMWCESGSYQDMIDNLEITMVSNGDEDFHFPSSEDEVDLTPMPKDYKWPEPVRKKVKLKDL